MPTTMVKGTEVSNRRTTAKNAQPATPQRGRPKVDVLVTVTHKHSYYGKVLMPETMQDWATKCNGEVRKSRKITGEEATNYTIAFRSQVGLDKFRAAVNEHFPRLKVSDPDIAPRAVVAA
jgi:hypothetical protein